MALERVVRVVWKEDAPTCFAIISQMNSSHSCVVIHLCASLNTDFFQGMIPTYIYTYVYSGWSLSWCDKPATSPTTAATAAIPSMDETSGNNACTYRLSQKRRAFSKSLDVDIFILL